MFLSRLPLFTFLYIVLQCWGLNNRGQLGLGDDTDRGDDSSLLGKNLKPVSLGSGDTPAAIDCGSEHTCVLLNDGAVKVRPAC